MNDNDEMLACLECGLWIDRNKDFTIVVDHCENCGEIHPIGLMHTECAIKVAKLDDNYHQMREAGSKGLN